MQARAAKPPSIAGLKPSGVTASSATPAPSEASVPAIVI